MCCNGCVNTGVADCNSCNEAAAVETHWNGCIETAAAHCNSCNESELQKHLQ